MTTILAYLDAGSGSMIVQLLVAGFAAVGVTAKLYWGRLKRLLRIGRPDAAEDSARSDAS